IPSPFVAPGYLTPVASLAIRTCAAGIARPEGSRIRPLIVPLGDCPTAALMRNAITRNGRKGKRNLIRAAPGSHGFAMAHTGYGRPIVFVSIFFTRLA